MSEEKNKVGPSNFSDKFYRLVAFTLIMTSIAIFFGTIFVGSYYIGTYGPQVFKDQGSQGYLSFTQIISGDMILKGLLTAIFVLLFAIVFMLNDLLRVLKLQAKE